MTLVPDAEQAARRVSELYRRNVDELGPQDVVVASHGGSGQSLIGNILFELGLNYVDAYTETLHNDGRAVVAPAHASYRRHLASLHAKDHADSGAATTLWPRFVKTHHPPVVFSRAPIGGVWVLVRDPRDALYASYQWRAGFAEEAWNQVPSSFVEWLQGRGDFSPSPVEDWCRFYAAWVERGAGTRQMSILRFEDLKRRPVDVVLTALRRLDVEVDASEVGRAVEASSFARMRQHEDQVAAQQGGTRPRVVRAGKTDGWKDWMTPELAQMFSSSDLHAMARSYGYDMSSLE